jgi:hypothetical protein
MGMLETHLMLQLQKDIDRDFIFQQDGVPQYFDCGNTSYLSRTVAARIGRGGTITWPPRSPDLTPLDFSVWRYVEDKVFVPALPAC